MTMMDTYGLKRKAGIVCWNCSGIGECEAGGMIKDTCPVCVDGFISKSPEKYTIKPSVKIDKRSVNYRKLKAMGLEDDEIQRKFDEAV